jgi:hypothetical protein
LELDESIGTPTLSILRLFGTMQCWIEEASFILFSPIFETSKGYVVPYDL